MKKTHSSDLSTKKVGLLTLPLENNYGGILQAVALFNYLKLKGISVCFMNNQVFENPFKKKLKKLLMHLPFEKFKNMKSHYLTKKMHEKFINEYIDNKTKPINSLKDFQMLIENKENFDVSIVGSDQVWRTSYIADGFERYFLKSNRNDLKRIAYAASFGNDDYDALNSNEILKLIKTFDFISIREQQAVNQLEKNGISGCVNVLDPTLLIEPKFFQDIVDKNLTSKEKIVVSYVLDRDKNISNGLESLFNTYFKDSKIINLSLSGHFSVKKWLESFRNAEYVVTDSYHGMLFSIIFQKNFLVIPNMKRGLARFMSILKKLNLTDRLVESPSDIVCHFKQLNSIDYEEVNKNLKELRSISESFITKSLSL